MGQKPIAQGLQGYLGLLTTVASSPDLEFYRCVSEAHLFGGRSEMFVRCFSAFAAMLMLLAGSTIGLAQEQLAWKFSAGESLQYVVKQNMKMTMNIADKTQQIAMSQTMDMQWKIVNVDPASGDVNMGQTVERVQMDSQGGPIGTLKFDSSSPEVPKTPYGKAIADVFKKLIGQEFGVHMLSTGKIDQVTVPDSLLAALKQSGSTGNALDENTLKQLMTQSAVVLPETPISTGHMWESMQQIEMPFGTMTVKSKLTFEGIDSSTGQARIAMTPSILLTPKQGTEINLKLTKTEGKGSLLFDVARGRITKSDLELRMEMQTNSFGQVIDQTIEQRTSMALAN